MTVYTVDFCCNDGSWSGYRQTQVCLAASYEAGLREGIKYAQTIYPEVTWDKDNLRHTINFTDVWIRIKEQGVVR